MFTWLVQRINDSLTSKVSQPVADDIFLCANMSAHQLCQRLETHELSSAQISHSSIILRG